MRHQPGRRLNLRLLFKVLSYALAFSVAGGALWFFFTYRIGVVPSKSMSPTLEPSDQYLINIRAYRHRPPRRGDIVVFRDKRGEYLVKRVIGIEGDWVVVTEGQVWVNRRPLREPYAVWQGDQTWPGRPFQAHVGKGQVFVLGDNRDFSEDSRDFGTVPLDHILGRGEYIIYPKSRRGSLRRPANQ